MKIGSAAYPLWEHNVYESAENIVHCLAYNLKETRKNKFLDKIMIIGSGEHQKLCRLLALCEKGTPTEVYAHILRCNYNVNYLNEEHSAIHYAPLYGYLPKHPLSAACIGDNIETARFLLQFGVDPDPDIKWGRFTFAPPRQFAIGKPQFMKLFDKYGEDRPWWRCPKVGLCAMTLNQLALPKPAVIIWHIMRGQRLVSPEVLLHSDVCKFPAALQEFICRIGIKREDYAFSLEWLAEKGADEQLLNIYRLAEAPCSEKVRGVMSNLVASLGLLGANRLFALVNNLLSPHDLVSLVMEYQEQYETSDDKEYIKNAMELLLGAMLMQCPE